MNNRQLCKKKEQLNDPKKQHLRRGNVLSSIYNVCKNEIPNLTKSDNTKIS